MHTTPPMTATSPLDIGSWLAWIEAGITTRPDRASRTWAWAYVIHALAQADLTDAADASPEAPGTTDAVWVVPQMAWAMDDLTDAGVHTQTPHVPDIPATLRPGLITALLRRLIITASVTDSSPPGLHDACTYAARRATVAHEAYTGPLP